MKAASTGILASTPNRSKVNRSVSHRYHNSQPANVAEIDWGTGGDSNVSDREKFTEETKTAAGGSEEQEKTVTLLDQEIRRDLQNDLLELSAFLAQRQAEMSALESEGLSSLLSG